MSVGYSSGIAEGWLFTEEERNIFNERTNYEFEDDFIFPNAYDGVGDSIFGQWILENSNVGTAINLTALKSELNLAEWIARLVKGGVTPKPPQTFLINQVY
jgi:hypothetical protein